METRALGILVAVSVSSAFAQSTFHGDNARSGVYASPGPASFGAGKWTLKTGGPIVASPVVADGTVYIASLDARLYAVDEESGKEQWNFSHAIR